MRLPIVPLVLVLTSCGLATGSGVVTTTTRDVTAFSKLSVASGITLKASPGEKQVTVLADENLQDLIETFVEGQTLVVRLKPYTVVGVHTSLEVTVTNDALEGIDASGGARAFVTATPVDTFRSTSSGGSTIEVANLASTDFVADASGGSDITYAGAATSGVAVASGGSHLTLVDLPLDTMRVDASGGSHVRARVATTLTGAASGGSTVTITGAPSSTVDSSGGSDVRLGAQ